MENLSNMPKRKKRRTRKYLDEIRDRLRRRINGKCFEQASQKSVNTKRLITLDRLTLQTIFPKAIRSDTITRPLLADIKRSQSASLVDFIKDKVENKETESVNQHNTECDTLNIGIAYDSASLSDSEATPLKAANISSSCNHGTESSNSFILLSPTSPEDKSLPISQDLDEEDEALSLPTSHDDYRYQLLEQFMNEIPSYFKRLTASICKEAVTSNTENSLQTSDVQSCRKDYKDNIRKCINGSTMLKRKQYCYTTEPIGENPTDYIRAERASPAAAPAPACDTPEYNYYPHRLN